MLNKNERDGKIDQVKGHVKQAVAAVTNDDKLKAEGKVDVAVGKAEVVVGEIGHKASDVAASISKAAKH